MRTLRELAHAALNDAYSVECEHTVSFEESRLRIAALRLEWNAQLTARGIKPLLIGEPEFLFFDDDGNEVQV